MPFHARLLVRTALAWLAVSLAVALAAALPGLLPAPGLSNALRPVWIHLLTVGWLTQLVFGVALWLFPRRGEEAGAARRAAPAAWLLLNLGLAARAAAEPATALGASGPWSWALAGSALLQWLAILLLIAAAWPRVSG